MSFQAFVWAWQQPVENAVDQHVLLALGNIAPLREVFASAAYIGKMIRRSERTVRRSLANLEATGFILIADRPGKTDLIRLSIPDDFVVTMPPDTDLEAGVRGRPRKKNLGHPSNNAGHSVLKTPDRVSDEPTTEPKDEPRSSLRSESVDPDLMSASYGDEDDGEDADERGGELVVVPDDPRSPFDKFWALYPRRTAKAKAREAWAKLEKKGSLPTLGTLLERTEEYRDAVRCWPESDQRRFTPHPATWLTAGRWDDDMDFVRRSHGTGTDSDGGLGRKGRALRSLHEAHLAAGD